MACALAAGGAWASDDWDNSGNPDNTVDTYNRLVHGTTQSHDLAALAGPTADNDWYRVAPAGRSSYEVVVDGWGGEPAMLSRYNADGSSQLEAWTQIDGAGYAYALRWMNTSSTTADQRVRVFTTSTAANTYDSYGIRMYETTIFLARFNNSGTQSTVLICQNPTAASIDARQYFWNAAGTLLTTNSITVAAHATSVASGVAGTAGQSGSVTIAHTGAYGSLNCKAVALEPATGYSFDTPGVYRVN